MITSQHLDDECVQLMLQFQTGDEAAFGQIVQEFHSVLFRSFLKQVRDWHTAEDLAQEVFMRVHRARNGYRPTAKFKTWLFCIARNVAINSTRTKSRRPEFGFGEAVHVDETSAAAADCPVERQETRSSVRRAINRLPDRQRDAINLQLDISSHKDIGQQMNLSPQAVKSLLSRARVNLKQDLGTKH